jgi:hypothetical protein
MTLNDETRIRRFAVKPRCRTRHSQVQMSLWQHKITFRCAMLGDSNLFVIARNKHIAPKQRRVERVPPGYSVREFQNDPRGRYWYVVTALEVRTGGGAPRPLSRQKLKGP